MPFNLHELQNGVAYWHNTNWPEDFHNAFYQDMIDINPQGNFDQAWWEQFLPVLGRWRATRPCSHAYFIRRAQNRFQRLSEAWADVIVQHLAEDIENVEWDHISVFPGIVSEIKNVASPVFSSKFCHFLAPAIFPVIDNAAMGNPFPTYQQYYSEGRREWCETDNDIRDALMDLITNEIGPTVAPDYPTKCKVIELCFIGRNQNNG